MAKKGARKSEKRLAAGRLIPLLRKDNTWSIKTRPGPHRKGNSAALGFVLRDMIGVAGTVGEAKRILKARQVLVDGAVATDYKRPVGLFDLVTVLPEKKTFRVLISRKGKLVIAEEEFGQREKICKVVGRKAVAGGLIRLATSDGRSFAEGKEKASVGDSLLIQVPEQKILKVVRQEPKKTVLVVDGRHIGEVAKVKDIVPGTMRRPKLATLETAEGEFRTIEPNVVIVGDSKPLIKVEG